MSNQMRCWFVGAKDSTDDLTVSTEEIRLQLLRFVKPLLLVTGR